MKLQILSDLHIDHKKNYGYFINRCHPRAETLIIAGDILPHNSLQHDGFIHKHLLPKWKNVIIIPGNHEFYGSTCDDGMFGSCMREYKQDDHRVYYCNNKVVEIDGIQFVCSSLWSHIGFEKAMRVQYSMNDYHQIRGLTVDEVNIMHIVNRQFLADSISKVPDNRKCIVITHHLPSFNLISERWRFNDLNDAFAADMDTFIMIYGDKISHWIHGHSHDYLNEINNGIHFIRNPMGYPWERTADMDFVIDI